MKGVTKERRKYRRTNMMVQLLLLKIVEVEPCEVSVSPGGLSFLTDDGFDVGDHVLFYMKNHSVAGSPYGIGEVVRVENTGNDGTRLVATKINDMSMRSLGRLIEWTLREAPVKTSIVMSVQDSYLHELLSSKLQVQRYDVFGNFEFAEALEKTVEKDPSVVIAEVGGTDEELEALAGAAGDSSVIVISKNAGMDLIARAATCGIFEVVGKPVSMNPFFYALGSAVRSTRHGVLSGVDPMPNLAGRSKAIEQVREGIIDVAEKDGHVLAMGETGTGKGRVIEEIHRISDHGDTPLKDVPFVKVDLASVNPNLIESELFGHEKGAFTGAEEQRIGAFERAAGGSVFLDEVGTLSPYLQQKLLGVLDKGEFTRVGGDEVVKLEARILAASNKDLVEEAGKGNFREDLLYRLSQNVINISPLRERREDILVLAKDLLDETTEPGEKRVRKLAVKVVEKLLGHDWLGNVRELRDALKASKKHIKDDTLCDLEIALPSRVRNAGESEDQPTRGESSPPPVRKKKLKKFLKEVNDRAEKAYLIECLKEKGYNVTEAAKLAGIARQNFYARMRKLGIPRKSSDK